MTRLKKYCTAALLFVYCIGIAVPLEHRHNEDATGTGAAAVSQHADADHCRHLPVAAHADCAVCAASVGRAVVVTTGTAVVSPLADEIHYTTLGYIASPFHFLSTQSHRGPPSLLG
jgi:hypothetical protein